MVRIRLFPILILLLGLGITFFLSFTSFKDMKNLKRMESESLHLEFRHMLEIQIEANKQVLYNSAAFILSSDTITRVEWQLFQLLNKSYTELPGIQGIGYAVVLPPDQLKSFEKRMCNEGFPEFKVFPEGKRKVYTSILFIEPFTELNKLAIGYDGFSDPVRRKAMELACDSNMAVISDKLLLLPITETNKNIGTIMYAPVFRKGVPTQTVEQRRSAIVGWVLSPFRLDGMIKSMLGDWDVQNIGLKIFDEHQLIPEKLLFDSDSIFQIKHQGKSKSMSNIPVNLDGKIWTLQFTNYTRDINFFSWQVLRVFLGGSFISILLFVFAVNLIAARAKTLRIQSLNEELKKVNVNKDRFISILAHDLKSPFNSLLGFSELLTENYHELEPHEIENYIKLISTSANHAYSLLDELLLWGRVQTDQFPYNPEKINLIELCKNQIEDHVLIAGKKKITVLINPSSSQMVMADEMMLKVIVRNLLMNAIKFTHEGGIIRIITSVKKNWVTVTIRDNGIGMTSEELSNLFEVSRLQSKSGTANEKGTGLGLLLCKDMVLKHGGKIWAESTPGKGSEFSFTLPQA